MKTLLRCSTILLILFTLLSCQIFTPVTDALFGGGMDSGLSGNDNAADADNDGVLDTADDCPGAGDLGYGVGMDGCPIEAPGVLYASAQVDGNFEILRIDLGSGDVTNLTNYAGSDGIFYGLDLSPDGRLVVFNRDAGRGHRPQLYIMDVDSGNLRQLTVDDNASHLHPRFSPDGTKIAYAQYSESTRATTIWIMDIDGGNSVQVSGEELDRDLPLWLDNEILLYLTEDGLGVLNISTGELDDRWYPSQAYLGCDVQPEGGSLVCSEIGGAADIFLLDLNTRLVTPLTSGGDFEQLPSWSSDGERIVFTAGKSQEEALQAYAIDPDGGNIEQLTDLDYSFDTAVLWVPQRVATTPLESEPLPEVQTSMTRAMDGMEMVYVPAGEFKMGSADGQADEKPVHTVYLDGFWIDRTEVTIAMFARFFEYTGYETDAERRGWSIVYTNEFEEIEGADWQRPFGPGSNWSDWDHPVVHISWNDAAAYCAWVGGRLPTEAEWEKAARGTDGWVYPWGDQPLAGDRANLADVNLEAEFSIREIDDGYEFTAPVGSYPRGASPYGALDMAGNVWEWVADWYAEDYYAISPMQNPTGPDSGESRVERGGGWSTPIGPSANRSYSLPDFGSIWSGFRCARDVRQEPIGGYLSYTVQPGDYIWRIAHDHEVDMNILMEINNLSLDSQLEVGQLLYIPRNDQGQRLNINTASAEKLAALPWISLSVAQQIVNYRAEHGAFTNIENIQDVPGIGPAIFDQIKDLITVEP